jgi:hypothetical protein
VSFVISTYNNSDISKARFAAGFRVRTRIVWITAVLTAICVLAA